MDSDIAQDELFDGGPKTAFSPTFVDFTSCCVSAATVSRAASIFRTPQPICFKIRPIPPKMEQQGEIPFSPKATRIKPIFRVTASSVIFAVCLKRCGLGSSKQVAFNLSGSSCEANGCRSANPAGKRLFMVFYGRTQSPAQVTVALVEAG